MTQFDPWTPDYQAALNECAIERTWNPRYRDNGRYTTGRHNGVDNDIYGTNDRLSLHLTQVHDPDGTIVGARLQMIQSPIVPWRVAFFKLDNGEMVECPGEDWGRLVLTDEDANQLYGPRS